MNYLILTELAWNLISKGPARTITTQGVSPTKQLQKELFDLQKINGKVFSFLVELTNAEARSAAPGTQSQLPQNFRGFLFNALRATHRDIQPIYSDRIAAGGPIRERLDAMEALMRDYFNNPRKPATREAAKAASIAYDQLRFTPVRGSLSRAFNQTVAKQIASSLKPLFPRWSRTLTT